MPGKSLALLMLPLTAFLTGPSAARGDSLIAKGLGETGAETVWNRSPLRFEANEGQFASGALFVARGPGLSLSLTRAGASVLALEASPNGSSDGTAPRPVELRFVGSDAGSVTGETPSALAHYFVGRDPAGWHRGVKTYQTVRYQALYPGIDLLFHGRQGRLEYDFLVAPGADPNRIELSFDGAEGVSLAANGDLVVRAGGGELVQPKPVLYQGELAARREVEGGYVVDGNRVRFSVSAYDRSSPLVIDPILSYSSYYGGSQLEEPFGIAHDAQGNVWVSGVTASSNLPAAETRDNTYGGKGDTFVAKYDSNGNLLFSTYLGGSDFEQSWGLVLDKLGNAYVVGNTKSTDFPVVGGLQSHLAGERDAYLAKFDASGSRLLFSTYLGGSGNDWGYAVDIDSKGAVYFAGETSSPDFPVRSAVQATYRGGEDAFVTKVSADGSTILYSTYLGGGNHERAWGLKVDGQGRAYIVGATSSPDFRTVNAFQKRFGGGNSDAFMASLSADGRKLNYATFAGGTSTDQGFAVAVDSKGNGRFVGVAGNGTFPTRQALQSFYAGGNGDAFVLGLTKGGGLQFSTLLGGSLADAAFSVAFDGKSGIYLTGQTESANFPLRGAMQSRLGGLRDGFLTQLRADGKAFVNSTFFGGDTIDEGTVIDLDAGGRIYLAGFTDGGIQLVRAEQSTFGGERDAFVARLSSGAAQSLSLSCAAEKRVLSDPSGDFVDVGFAARTEGGDPATALSIEVYGDDGAVAQDAELSDGGRLRLRAETSSATGDRVYVILVSARDRAGNWSTATCSVAVPRTSEPEDAARILERAAASENYFELHRAFPAGFARLNRSAGVDR